MSASPRSPRSGATSARQRAQPQSTSPRSQIASPRASPRTSPHGPGGARAARAQRTGTHSDGLSPRMGGSMGSSPRMGSSSHSPRMGGSSQSPGNSPRAKTGGRRGSTSSDFLDEALAIQEEKAAKKGSFWSFGSKSKSEKDEDELSDVSSLDEDGEKIIRQPRKCFLLHYVLKLCICIVVAGRIFRFVLVFLFDFLTCHARRRRHVRKFNSWVVLGDRESRLNITRAKKKEFVEKQNEDLRSKGYRSYWLAVLSTMQRTQRTYQDTKLLLMELFGRVDKKTGLPTSVIEQWKFVKLVNTGSHGYLFEAVGQTKSHLQRTAMIKLRDKSIGQVFNMPYQRSMQILKSQIIVKDRNILLRLLAKWRIFKSDFHNVCLAETYDVFDSSEFFVEVQEKFSHGSVYHHLEQTGSQLDEYAACSVFKRIVKGLEYLHHHRIIHRDVRLSQVLIPKAIKKNGLAEVRLGDLWCMAKLPRRSPLIEKDLPLFTPVHAPEVITEGYWTDKADMWSVGCLLFELLYGHLPFGGHGKALVQRICTQPPEYDALATQLSDLALDLLKGLLKRDFHKRFSARHALHHDWVTQFSALRPEMQALREPNRIRRVKIVGRPACRRGMPAENLLSAKTGMFNSGWCSYMGSTSCALDFELGAGEKKYWVTQVTASLWASDDNPREIIMMATSRPDVAYSEVHKERLESSSIFQATIEVDKPIEYARVRFFRNFGGSYGIALRKLTFYGYEIRAVRIDVDFDAVILTNDAAFWMHNEYITDVNKVHKSLRDYLEKGEAIAGSGARYRKYRDIHSGPSHMTTVIGSFMPPLPPGLTIIAASLNLQYVSWAMHNQTPPRLKILIETEFGERIRLFQTSDLAASDHEPDSIVTFGYSSLPIMYSEPLNIPTEFGIQIEVHCENNAGFLHLPPDYGLTFYYLPNLSTPSDSEEEEAERDREKEEKKTARKKKKTKKAEDLEEAIEAVENEKGPRRSMRGSKRSSISSIGGMGELEIEDGSNFEAYEEELELREDYMVLEKNAKYGPMGQPEFEREELPAWQPEEMPVDEQGLGQEKTDNWMDIEAGRSSDDYSSGTVQQCGTSQTTADTLQPRTTLRSTKVGARDHEGVDSPNNSDDEEAQKDKENENADLEELRIRTAFVCDEARTRIFSEIQARAHIRAIKAQSRYSSSRRGSLFSLADRGGVQCIQSLRQSPLGQHCQPAIQVLEGCSAGDVPKAFQACVPARASQSLQEIASDPLDLGFFPEQSEESEQQESGESEKPTTSSKDRCTLQ